MATSDSTPKTVEIQLTKGFVAIVDECDGDLAEFKWYASHHIPEYAYAARKLVFPGRITQLVLMHCIILERILERPLLPGEKCDHIHHNPRDNRRSELRLASTSQNGMNRRLKVNSVSGYKGVSPATDGNWQVSIKVAGEKMYLGLYATPEEGYAAYCIAARQYFGEFAYLPDEDKVAGIIPVRLVRPKVYRKRG